MLVARSVVIPWGFGTNLGRIGTIKGDWYGDKVELVSFQNLGDAPS